MEKWYWEEITYKGNGVKCCCGTKIKKGFKVFARKSKNGEIIEYYCDKECLEDDWLFENFEDLPADLIGPCNYHELMENEREDWE